MPLYGGFYDESVKIIEEALLFAKAEIERYRDEKSAMVDARHFGVIEKEFRDVLREIRVVERFIKETAIRGIYSMDAKRHEEIMDIIRSSLEIHLRDTVEAKAKSGLAGFDAKIQEIRQVTALEGLKNRKTDLYDKYFGTPTPSPEGRKVEVFFSYSHEDKALAGKIATLLKKNEIDVFLAHEDIEVTKEWRDEIFKHLKSSSFLLALLTPNFQESVWANQETGYMHARGEKVFPLIVGEADIKKFGFLEALQAIQVDEEKLNDCVKEILRIILR